MPKFEIYYSIKKINGYTGSSYIERESESEEALWLIAYNEVILHLIGFNQAHKIHEKWNQAYKELSITHIKQIA